jgi:hypothetical protein
MQTNEKAEKAHSLMVSAHLPPHLTHIAGIGIKNWYLQVGELSRQVEFVCNYSGCCNWYYRLLGVFGFTQF